MVHKKRSAAFRDPENVSLSRCGYKSSDFEDSQGVPLPLFPTSKKLRVAPTVPYEYPSYGTIGLAIIRDKERASGTSFTPKEAEDAMLYSNFGALALHREAQTRQVKALLTVEPPMNHRTPHEPSNPVNPVKPIRKAFVSSPVATEQVSVVVTHQAKSILGHALAKAMSTKRSLVEEKRGSWETYRELGAGGDVFKALMHHNHSMNNNFLLEVLKTHSQMTRIGPGIGPGIVQDRSDAENRNKQKKNWIAESEANQPLLITATRSHEKRGSNHGRPNMSDSDPKESPSVMTDARRGGSDFNAVAGKATEQPQDLAPFQAYRLSEQLRDSSAWSREVKRT